MVVVGLFAGILSALRTPLYQATARVLLTPNDPTQQLNPTGGNGVVGNDPDRYVAGQINIVESENVARDAVKTLQGVTINEVESAASASQVGQTNVIKIAAKDSDPARAHDIANALASGYIENRRLAAVAGLQQAADDIEAKLGPLQAQIAALDTQIGDGSTIPGATASLTSPVKPGSVPPAQAVPQVPAATDGIGGVPSTQEALKAARYAAAVQYETLYSREQELLVDISLKRGDAELIAAAKTPTSPVSPRPKRDAALGVVIGLLLGGGISLLREQLNDRVRSTQEVETITGLPILAQLPYDEGMAKGANGVAAVENPTGPLSEAIRSLRTSIQYLGIDRPVKVIVVTSAAPGEGKSLVAANLAVAFAQADRRTILISADLRRSSIDELFGDAGSSPGLTGVLANYSANGNGRGGAGNGHHVSAGPPRSVESLYKTGVSGLCLLPAGPTPPNPAELLGSQRMSTILKEYANGADVIIIDSPPLLPVTDAAVLAAKVDGVILVTALNETRRDGLQRAQATLTGARVLGVVVNKAPASGPGGYYYAGYYGKNTNPRQPRQAGLRERTSEESSPDPAEKT